MTKFVRYGLAAIVGVAWLFLMAASMTANVRFGLAIAGQEGWNHYVLGGATAASDIFKAAAPIAGLWFVSRRWWWPAMAAVAVVLVTTAYSTVAAIGFGAVTRASYSDTRVMSSVLTAGNVADLTQLRRQQEWTPQHRPVGAIENEIERQKKLREWDWTEGCTKIDKQTRKFCEDFGKLGPELEAAKGAQAIEAKIAAIEAKVRGTNFVQDADPQAKVFSSLTGASIAQISTAMTILLAALLEIGSAFGLTLALALVRPEKGIIADALATVMPQDPRRSDAGPFVAAPANTFARGTTPVKVGIIPMGQVAQVAEPPPPAAVPASPATSAAPPAEAKPNERIVRKFSLKPPFITTEVVKEPERKRA